MDAAQRGGVPASPELVATCYQSQARRHAQFRGGGLMSFWTRSIPVERRGRQREIRYDFVCDEALVWLATVTSRWRFGALLESVAALAAYCRHESARYQLIDPFLLVSTSSAAPVLKRNACMFLVRNARA